MPLVLAVAATLAVQGWRRGAIVWCLVVASTFAIILGLKLIFLSCSPVFGPIDVHSPSGHVAAAGVVSGGLAVMLTGRQSIILPAALVAALVIGISRIVLGMHSLPEVIIGTLVGVAGAAALMRFAGHPPNRPVSLKTLTCCKTVRASSASKMCSMANGNQIATTIASNSEIRICMNDPRTCR